MKGWRCNSVPGYFPNKYKVLGSSPSTIIKTRHSAYYTLTWRPEVMFKYREMLQGLYFRQAPNNRAIHRGDTEYHRRGYVRKGGSLASPQTSRSKPAH